MKLIVDISDEMYELCKRGTTGTFLLTTGMRSGKTFLISLYKAIANGTPLLKGHGRIKDIDKIEWYGCTTEFDCPHKDRECKDCVRAQCSKTQVDNIPTIIEADKESEEKE